MTPRANDPYQLQKLLSRRSFLGVSGVGAASAVGLTLRSPQRRPTHHPPSSVKVADAGSAYHQPFALESSCVLSEDHFLVKLGKIDLTDKSSNNKVMAYSRGDGEVEAVLLEAGTISQVYRDPGAPGGWTSTPIAAGATDMVAGVADNRQGYPTLHVFYRVASGEVKHLIEDYSAGASTTKFTSLDDVKWGTQVKGPPLQITNDLYRNLLVFCITPASSQNATDSKLGFHWTGWGMPGGQTQSGVLTGFGLHQSPQSSLPGGSAVISHARAAFLGGPALMLYVPSPGGVQLYQWWPDYQWVQTEHLNVTDKVQLFNEQPPALPDTVAVESIDYASSPGVNYLPTAFVRGVNQELYAFTNDWLGQQWHVQPLQLPTDVKRRPGSWDWEPSNLNMGEDKGGVLLNLFVASGGTLSVVRQVDLGTALKNSVTPVYNPAVPLQKGVTAVTSQARASNGDELIVVDGGGNLEVLTKLTDGTWNATQIHLKSDEAVEVSTYRVQLTLSDDWGARLANRPLQVTAAAPAVALLSGKGVTLSSTPVTFTTDGAGQVTIPIVADGLWTPKLTISGGGLSSPVTVSPSTPVNDYMTGTATLNTLPPLTGDALTGASTPSGAAVFPGAKQHADVAADAATVLGAVAAAGSNPTVNAQVAFEDRSGGLNGLAPDARAMRMPRRPVSVGSLDEADMRTFKVDGIELSFGDLARDALYAVKKGAAKVDKVLVSADKSLNRWVCTITADFDAWAHQAIQVTIQGLEDAAHVFHGVINHLEGVLDDVIDWLKAHVLKLLADTVTLAARYDGWLLQLSSELSTLTQKAKGRADTFLQGKEPELRAALAKVKAQLGSRSVSSFMESSTSSAQGNASPQQAPQQPTSANASWLLEKVGQSGVTHAGVPAVNVAFDTLVKQAQSSISSVGQDFIKATNDFRAALAGLVSNPKNFGTAGIGRVIDALGDVITAALHAAQGMIDLVLNLVDAAIAAFTAILNTQLNTLPLVGPLLKAAGFTTPLTISRLITLLVAFPTVLGYKLAHRDSDALPFKGVTTTSELRAADVKDDLDYTTFAATSFWALMDTIAAAMIGGGSEPPALFAWIDIAAPAVISALTVPGHDDGLPFTSTIKLDDDGDVLTAVSWGVGALPGVLAAFAYFVAEKYPASAEAASESALCLTSMSGFFGAVFGVIAAVTTSSNPADAALPATLAVLGNTAAGLAYGLEKEVVASTDGLSALLAGVIGGVCTLVASGMDLSGVA